MAAYLQDKVVVITGAGSGIGKTTALAFAREGASVVIGDIDQAAGNETARDILASGGFATAVKCDVRKPEDVVQAGDIVETVVLEVKPAERRIALGLKQALGNPWDTAAARFAPGTVVEGTVTNLAQFGAFVDLGDGIEGMIHVGDITREKRVQHPKEMLSPGQVVKAQVLEVDADKRRIRLSMRALEPTSADIFIAEHQVGDLVSGRVVETHSSHAKVEISEGVHARCRLKDAAPGGEKARAAAADVDGLAALLAAKWKGGASSESDRKTLRTGQLRRFRIVSLDAGHRRIEVEVAD